MKEKMYTTVSWENANNIGEIMKRRVCRLFLDDSLKFKEINKEE